jgi:tetratricopeptide (TPR) repeat protein
MKRMKTTLIALTCLAFAACNSSAPTPVANSSANTSADRPMRSGQMQQQNTIAHTTENQPPRTASNTISGPRASGGEPIDTAKFDGVIAEAEKTVKSKPDDDQAKKTLAQAYFDRAFALTQPPARQYAAALGDYRRALKYDPNHDESKQWIDQISMIFRSLGKEPPKEGEEPAPLPFKK